MDNKKTKLTISGRTKKTFKNFDSSKNLGKKTVVIGKKTSKPFNKGNFNKPSGTRPLSSNFKRDKVSKPSFNSKILSTTSDFERRKLAEQRATKRLKGDTDNKDKNKDNKEICINEKTRD